MSAAVIEVRVPDIGDFKNVPVLEVLVQPGALIEMETPVITLESEKATIDVPSPVRGTVRELAVKVGDLVSKGSVMFLIDAVAAATPVMASPGERRVVESAPLRSVLGSAQVGDSGNGASGAVERSMQSVPDTAKPQAAVLEALPSPSACIDWSGRVYAGPAVRSLARRLGVDLAQVMGSGPRGRIIKEDVHAFVKRRLTEPAAAAAVASTLVTGGLVLEPWPKVDFEKYGAIERRELSRIQKRSGAAIARNWAVIPHVTNFDEADVTDLEAFRLEINKEGEGKVTMLAFLIKTAAAALRKYPAFNASLDGDTVILKQYCHVGFAADTPNGLVVPVIRDADAKGLLAIAAEANELAAAAREGKLKASDMEGGCFSVSSLGGIGGVGFTPIINAPEVAILGAARARMLPRWIEGAAVGRLVLPLSLSWDHRVVDGVAAGKFLVFLRRQLEDLRRWLL